MSDYFDGIVARRHGTTTSGAFLDPLADKVIVLGSLYALILARRTASTVSSFRRDHHASRDLDERLSLPRGAARNLHPGEQAREVEDLHPGLGDCLLCHTVDGASHVDRRHGHLDRGRLDGLYRLAVLREGRTQWIEIVAVGTELLLGQIPTRTLSARRHLAAHGIASQFHQHVGTITNGFFCVSHGTRAQRRGDRVRGLGRPRTTSLAPRWPK